MSVHWALAELALEGVQLPDWIVNHPLYIETIFDVLDYRAKNQRR